MSGELHGLWVRGLHGRSCVLSKLRHRSKCRFGRLERVEVCLFSRTVPLAGYHGVGHRGTGSGTEKRADDRFGGRVTAILRWWIGSLRDGGFRRAARDAGRLRRVRGGCADDSRRSGRARVRYRSCHAAAHHGPSIVESLGCCPSPRNDATMLVNGTVLSEVRTILEDDLDAVSVHV